MWLRVVRLDPRSFIDDYISNTRTHHITKRLKYTLLSSHAHRFTYSFKSSVSKFKNDENRLL